MPKLRNHTFSTITADDQRYEFESDIHVSSDGEFSCTVPEYLVESLGSVAAELNKVKRGLSVQRLKVNHRAYGPTLPDLLKYVGEALKQHYAAVVTTDLVICYDWFAEMSYWLNPDGTMAANGSMPDAAERRTDGTGGDWNQHWLKSGEMISANAPAQHFSVGMYAAIHRRTTYTRSSGSTVVWSRISQFESRDSLGEWGSKLAGLCGLSAPKAPLHLRQMPYTDQAAKFFYESMMAMCEIGRRFKNFFSDEANVLAAIEGRGPSMLAPPEQRKHCPPIADE